MPLPYKVGLTGGIGSGKSVVSNLFSGLGVPVIDADSLIHKLTGPGMPAVQRIACIFGNEILDRHGNLKRKELGDIVFSDPDLKHQLESVLHPLVYEKMGKMIDQVYASYCILGIPLLLETSAETMVDRILVVDTPESVQIDRVSRRDGLSREQVEQIMSSQVSRKTRLNSADDVIINDGDLQQLESQVTHLHAKYLELAKGNLTVKNQ